MAGFDRRGYSLVELIVATLVIALMAGPILSVGITGKMSEGRTERRQAAASSLRRLSEALKNYVVADTTLALGPGIGYDGWSLPGDASGRRALEAGRHPLDGAQWAPLLGPYNVRVAYDVAVRTTPSGPQPDVSFEIAWDEP